MQIMWPAAQYLHTPGQNIVFAAKNGDIALRTQGDWPAKMEWAGRFYHAGCGQQLFVERNDPSIGSTLSIQS